MQVEQKINAPEPKASDVPSLPFQVLRALPATAVSTASMWFTVWFGSTHYLPDVSWIRKRARGAQGEKFMPSEAKLLEDMRKVVHYLKAFDPDNPKEYQYSVGEFLDITESFADKYGLPREVEQIRALRNETVKKFNETAGAESVRSQKVDRILWLNEKLTDRIAQEGVQQSYTIEGPDRQPINITKKGAEKIQRAAQQHQDKNAAMVTGTTSLKNPLAEKSTQTFYSVVNYQGDVVSINETDVQQIRRAARRYQEKSFRVEGRALGAEQLKEYALTNKFRTFDLNGRSCTPREVRRFIRQNPAVAFNLDGTVMASLSAGEYIEKNKYQTIRVDGTEMLASEAIELAQKSKEPTRNISGKPMKVTDIVIEEVIRPDKVRGHVRKVFFELESELFQSLTKIFRHSTDVEKAKASVGAHAEKFFQFRDAHNKNVISSYRTPLTIGLTGAVALGTMISSVSKQREKVALSERIEQLEQGAMEEVALGR